MVRPIRWPGRLRAYEFFPLLLAFILILSFSFKAAALPGSRPPRWMTALSKEPLPELPPETPAVYLLLEQNLSCDKSGRLVRAGRQVIKILRSQDIEPLKFLARANTFNTRIRKMNAWVINPDGSKKSYNLKSVVSTSLAPDTLYWDIKTLYLHLEEITKGTLIGYEWEEEIQPISLEDVFVFQFRFPVLKANYRVEYPSSYQLLISWINWPEIPVTFKPGVFTVSLFSIPAIKDEPLMPPDEAVAGRLQVRFKPASTPKYGIFFSDWKDMGLWYERLSSERRQPDENVRARANELVSGLADLKNRIEKLAAFVQQEIRYVSIQIGIGGYQPHKASEILAKGYGDCKDKATLLAAFLDTVKVDSYYLIVNTFPKVVKENSQVSLFCFNHVVLAIKLPDEKLYESSTAVVEVPGIGRLLIFDPTMPHTPIGHVPFYLQNNCGLLVAGENSRLIKIPGSSSEKPQLIRRGRFMLSTDGTLSGEVSETLSGLQAEVARLELRNVNERKRREKIEKFLADSVGSFMLEKYDYINLDDPEKNLEIHYSFRSNNYLNRTGDVLSFRPTVLALLEDYEILKQKGERKYPLLTGGAGTSRDELEIILPKDFTVEVLSPPVELSNDFAEYHSYLELEGGVLKLTRHFVLKEDYLPPERFNEAVEIFRLISKEERRRLLLKKIDRPD